MLDHSKFEGFLFFYSWLYRWVNNENHMPLTEQIEHAILNFFRVKNAFAPMGEMFQDLRGNGLQVYESDLEDVFRGGWLDHKYENGLKG